MTFYLVGAADVIADAILMYFPLHLFRDLLDKSLHLKLGLIFSTCVVTTVVSATYLYQTSPLLIPSQTRSLWYTLYIS